MGPTDLRLPSVGHGEGEVSRALPDAPSARAAAAARHEAAHLICAHVLGRPHGGAHANGAGGEAVVALTREDVEVPLEEVVDDLTILAVGDELDRRSWPRFRGQDHDAEMAWKLATAYTANRDEAEQLVELARAKARTLLDREWVVALVEQLSSALLEAGELDGEQVKAILEGGTHGKA
jgi:hypothetical protein